ncbi:nucleoside-diphosphate kinase [bacterium]|nr:MAG: nucleoside-diphosphate kinase [bacterium]
MERTLVNIKPDAVRKHLIGEIIKRIESGGYQVVAMDKLVLSRKEAEVFYAIHRGKSFFSDLIDFMISGPCVPMVVEGEDVITGIRNLIGSTDPAQAKAGTIRKDYGENVTRNVVHASDSPETARDEIRFFFSERKLI